MKNDERTRLQVYLARCGIASRRACERLIDEGRVAVNGSMITRPGTKVGADDEVTFDGRIVRLESTYRYIALHKPSGYVCTKHDPEGRPTADSLLSGYHERLHNVGRLDIDSSGLIFFTNDGDFTRIVTHPSSCIEKEYLVESSEPLDPKLLDPFIRGVTLEGVHYRIDDYTIRSKQSVVLKLHAGKNREIRVLFGSAGLSVRRIHRIRIGIVKLGSLAPGEHRMLSKHEIEWLKKQDLRV